METPRNEVSSKCAATSLTFHFGETVCFSQSSGASERRSSINIPSIFGKRCAVRMGFNGSIRRFIKCSTSEIKTVAENHLGNQVIRRTRHTHTEPKIDFPLGREIHVNGGEDLLLLLADRVEARDRTQRAVIFESPRDFLGEIVAELEVGRENDSLIHAWAVKGAIKRGIEGEIPPAELFINDRANLPCPGIRRVAAALPADFVREADADGPVPLGRNAHAWTDMAADVIPALAALRGSENVESGLKPVCEALKREIGMELHHRVARLNGFVRIHLDFVVPLRDSAQRQGDARERTKPN